MDWTRGSIDGVSLPRSFAGKSVLAALLCHHYGMGDGRDAMAWALKNPGQCNAIIEERLAAEGRRPLS